MQKRDVSQLAIFQIDNDMDMISIASLRKLYLYNSSEIVYIVKGKILYGIVCKKEILYHTQNEMVRINKNFKVLNSYNIIKAHKIFQQNRNIHNIPVTNRYGQLLGDYSIWDDNLSIIRLYERVKNSKFNNDSLKIFKKVYIIEPCTDKKEIYWGLLNYMEKLEVGYKIIDKSEVNNRLEQDILVVFVDEDEKAGVECLYQYECDQYGRLKDTRGGVKFITYVDLLRLTVHELEVQSLGIKKPDDVPYNAIDEKTTILFSALREKGIMCFCTYIYGNKITEYGQRFMSEIAEKAYECSNDFWPRKRNDEKLFKAFFDNLSELQEYDNEMVQRETVEASLVFEREKNIAGKYFNAKEGRRSTCFQPSEYIGTIYLLGPCTIIGFLQEDQYTIASYLQKLLLENGYAYRVENCGSIMSYDSRIDSRLREIGKYNTNDIVIMLSRIGMAAGILGISLEEIFEKNQVSSFWVTDGYTHCNHRVNQIISNSFFEMMVPFLRRNTKGKMMKIDFASVMKDYVRKKYINQYFEKFLPNQYGTIGAIVMNCNPYSKGHHYLIDQARQQMDFLIIFVVEEDESLFPFEERFKLVVEGTKRFENVMVVPSGEFILSKNNFAEYFSKVEDRDVSINAEYDINIFADCIAGELHITHRFVGEEPEDRVTRVYNETMKRILPKKGIRIVELPRITIGSEIVSASRVRRYLETEEYEKAFILVPETTKEYLLQQI